VLRGFDLTSVAQLASIGAAISYAVSIVYARRIRSLGIDPIVLTCGQLLAATVIALPLALGVEHPLHLLSALSASAWWAWLGLAVPGTALAYVIYFRIMMTAGATNAASVTFLAPIVAVLLGTFALGEHPVPTTIVGMFVIFAGQAVLDGRILRLFSRWRAVVL
jgi:drug/metabolite transporter (DMT)-like permease